jgi:hypothetical protein
MKAKFKLFNYFRSLGYCYGAAWHEAKRHSRRYGR